MVLGTSFIDCCIPDITPIKCKVVLWHSRALSILCSLQIVSLVFFYNLVVNMESAPILKLNDLDNDEELERLHLLQVSRQTKIPLFTQASASFICHREGLLLVETYSNIIERRCSITGRGHIDILLTGTFLRLHANMLV